MHAAAQSSPYFTYLWKTFPLCGVALFILYANLQIMSGGLGREHTRMKVRERDNWTCKDCGFIRTPNEVKKHNSLQQTLKGKIKSLDVHHLNGQCGLKTLLYDRVSEMGGLITLCHRCHYNRHDNRQVADGNYGLHFPTSKGTYRLSRDAQIMSVWQAGLEMKSMRRKFLMSEAKIKSIIELNV